MSRLIKLILIAVFLLFVSGTVWAYFALKEPIKTPVVNKPDTKQPEDKKTKPAPVAKKKDASKPTRVVKPKAIAPKVYVTTEYTYEIVTYYYETNTSASSSSSSSSTGGSHAEAHAW